MKISEILKDTNYKLTQFKDEYIQEIESLIFEKELRKKPTKFIKSLIEPIPDILKANKSLKDIFKLVA